MMEPLYICVHVPEFPAQAMLRHRPELADKAVVVLSGEAPLEQVASANRIAMRLGVTRGMTRTELEMFAGLIVLRRSNAEECSARTALLEAAGAFTPRVEVQRSDADQIVMVLDMAGAARIFGPPTQMVRRIAQTLRALRFFVQLAASANLDASMCMAPFAKAAPAVLSAGEEARKLGPLPLCALRPTPKQAETLALWGLKTVGELAALPEVDLVVRLGQEGKRLRLLALGAHPHLMVPEEPAFSLEESLEFDAPVELLDSLLFAIGPMLDQLLVRAQNRAFALASVTVTLGLDGAADHTRTLKPALPVAQRDPLLKLLHLDLQAHPPVAAVMRIFIHAEPGDRSKVQLGLFAPQLPEPLRLDVTLARIAALVGEERVGRAKLLDTHRPESFVMERFIVPTTPVKQSNSTRSAVMRRCRPPVAISMRRNERQLDAFTLRGKTYSIRQACGPWRTSGQWWSSDVWSQEEWDVCGVEAEGGLLLCLITHDLLCSQWYLSGLYD